MEEARVETTIEVVQNVYVTEVVATLGGARVVLAARDRPFVRVDYRFGAGDRRRHLDTLRRWRLDRFPLTFVQRAGQVALIDEWALLRRAMSGDS
jgi:hypothetical protein